MAARRPLWLALLGLVLVGVLAVVFLPIGWQLNRFVVWLYYFGQRLGVPRFVPLDAYDVGLNMLLVAVPTAIAAALWPRVRPWVWVVAVAVFSITVESIQYLALPREASIQDVIASVAGAVLAVVAVRAVTAVMSNRAPASA